MFVEEVIAFAILKSLGDFEWSSWTKMPYTFVGYLDNKYCKTKKVIVDSDEKEVIIITEDEISAREITKLSTVLGNFKIKHDENGRIIIKLSW